MSRVHGLIRRFWAGELGAGGAALGAALAPAEAAYRLGAGLRDQAFRRGLLEVTRALVPVISVGNLAVGGTGKTPFAHWLAVGLAAHGRRPAVLHGGYADDEPELHRQWSPDIPVVVERSRAAGADRAVAGGADVLVLDDGFQHRRLHRDLDIVLVSAERWDGPRRLLPRGPWREPPAAMGRADIIVVTRKTAPAQQAQRVADEIGAAHTPPVLRVHLRSSGWRNPAGGADRALGPAPAGAALLVCGLAEPELFIESARQAGAEVGAVLSFADHHDYGPADARRIRTEAGGRSIVTTEKDWTKLEPLLGGADVRLLVQEVVMESGDDLLAARLAALFA